MRCVSDLLFTRKSTRRKDKEMSDSSLDKTSFRGKKDLSQSLPFTSRLGCHMAESKKMEKGKRTEIFAFVAGGQSLLTVSRKAAYENSLHRLIYFNF